MPSYTHRTMNAVLTAAEKEKKRKYAQAVKACHASFSPFMLSVGGIMAWEAGFVVWCFTDKLSTK